MTSVEQNPIRVEVAYAEARQQRVLTVSLPAPATIADALHAARVERYFPSLDPFAQPVGVWGKVYPIEHRVSDGDRVEIYRELAADPREMRRVALAESATMSGRTVETERR